MAVDLEYLARGKGPLSPQKLSQVQRWVDEDWESCDHDRNLVKLVQRLLDTIHKEKMKHGR